MLCPLITAVSHLMQLAQLKALRTMVEGLSIFSVLIAEPATGKTPALKLLRRTLLEIETFLSVELENSKLVNGKLLKHYLTKLISFN